MSLRLRIQWHTAGLRQLPLSRRYRARVIQACRSCYVDEQVRRLPHDSGMVGDRIYGPHCRNWQLYFMP